MKHFFIELSQFIYGHRVKSKTLIDSMQVEITPMDDVKISKDDKQFSFMTQNMNDSNIEAIKSFVLYCHEFFQVKPEEWSVIFYVSHL